MKYHTMAALCLFLCIAVAQAELPRKNIKLPTPDQSSGMPLMKALSERSSNREFLSGKEVPLQMISDLLWAADGINRPESGKRTAPSAMNWQDVKLYLVTVEAVYSYDPVNHALFFECEGNHMKETGSQEFVEDASANIVFVSDFAKMTNAESEDKMRFASFHVGAISQNISLYCASAGMITVVRGSFDEKKMREVLHLHDEQTIIMAQSIGFRKPKK